MTRENAEKLKLADDLINHRSWNKLLVPWLDEHIEKNKDLTKIRMFKDDDIVLEVKKRLSKIDVYKNLKNLPEQIINEIKSKEEENNDT